VYRHKTKGILLKVFERDSNFTFLALFQCGALTAAVQKEIVTEADRLEIRNKVTVHKDILLKRESRPLQ
jgi:hypothetical protein